MPYALLSQYDLPTYYSLCDVIDEWSLTRLEFRHHFGGFLGGGANWSVLPKKTKQCKILKTLENCEVNFNWFSNVSKDINSWKKPNDSGFWMSSIRIPTVLTNFVPVKMGTMPQMSTKNSLKGTLNTKQNLDISCIAYIKNCSFHILQFGTLNSVLWSSAGYG